MTKNEEFLDNLEIGEEFWDDETGVRMIKFSEGQYAIIMDERGMTIQKPKEH